MAISNAKDTSPTSREVAFYYPGHIWHSGDALKSLLLFFDGVALLVPRYTRNAPEEADPVMVGPLRRAGLLHMLEPEVLVDKEATEQLSSAIGAIIQSGGFDKLEKDGTAFRELSYSRLGGYGDQALANAILDELKKRRLARDSEDGLSIPMHPMVRSTVLVLLAQILRPKGPALGMNLSPATDRPELVGALCEMLAVAPPVSSAGVVSFDLEAVGPDLSSVPLDEVLDFRRDNLAAFKDYARNVRKFVMEIGAVAKAERDKALRDRRDEIRDLAADLKRTGRKAWKKPASFALGIAGAAWMVKTGDLIGGLLATAGLITGAGPDAGGVTAYSYLFRARNRYP